MRAFLHRCLTRTPIIGLLMAAVLFRALIPAGFMPAQADSGEIVMQLCAGFDTKSVVVDLDGGATQHGTQLFDHSPCGFTAAAAAPPPAPLALDAARSPDSASTERDTGFRIAPSPRRAHSPRAPPLA
jgi:hypothetical protein